MGSIESLGKGIEYRYLVLLAETGSECFTATKSERRICDPESRGDLHNLLLLTFLVRLKCNRSHPCENCVKRGDAMSCSYAAIGSRKKQPSSSQSSHSPDGMQNRIDRLEGLVLSLMTNGPQSAGPAIATRALSMSNSTGSMDYPQDVGVDTDDQESGGGRGEVGDVESETEQVSQSLGMMKVNNNISMYFGDAHWATILSDVG